MIIPICDFSQKGSSPGAQVGFPPSPPSLSTTDIALSLGPADQLYQPHRQSTTSRRLERSAQSPPLPARDLPVCTSSSLTLPRAIHVVRCSNRRKADSRPGGGERVGLACLLDAWVTTNVKVLPNRIWVQLREAYGPNIAQTASSLDLSASKSIVLLSTLWCLLALPICRLNRSLLATDIFTPAYGAFSANIAVD